MRARSAARRIVAVGVCTGIVLLGPTAAPASAHGGAGDITLVNVEPTGSDTVAVEVCVTFTLDREQADTARVTVRAQGPDGAEVNSQPLAVGEQPGLRTGELTFPTNGSWTILVESTFPPAQLTVPVTVGGEDRPSVAGTALDPPSTTATCEGESDGETPTWLVAGLGSAVAIVVFGGLLLLLRRATTPAAAERDG